MLALPERGLGSFEALVVVDRLRNERIQFGGSEQAPPIRHDIGTRIKILRVILDRNHSFKLLPRQIPLCLGGGRADKIRPYHATGQYQHQSCTNTTSNGAASIHRAYPSV